MSDYYRPSMYCFDAGGNRKGCIPSMTPSGEPRMWPKLGLSDGLPSVVPPWLVTMKRPRTAPSCVACRRASMKCYATPHGWFCDQYPRCIGLQAVGITDSNAPLDRQVSPVTPNYSYDL